MSFELLGLGAELAVLFIELSALLDHLEVELMQPVYLLLERLHLKAVLLNALTQLLKLSALGDEHRLIHLEGTLRLLVFGEGLLMGCARYLKLSVAGAESSLALSKACVERLNVLLSGGERALGLREAQLAVCERKLALFRGLLLLIECALSGLDLR